MKKTVWIFGLISGSILSVLMLMTIPFESSIGYDRAEVIGYTTMVLAFLLVFFGIRSYRDNIGGGVVSFGRALAVGTLITVIASACYVATWEVIYFGFKPDFATQYAAHTIDKLKASGASAEEVARQTAELQQFAVRYRNPFYNSAVTFLEPLPVGLVIVLVSAGVLRRRRNGASDAAMAQSPAGDRG